MASVNFDTLKFVNRLKQGGFSDQQAEAELLAVKDALGEVVDSHLASKAEILNTKADFTRLENATKSDIAGIQASIKADFAHSENATKTVITRLEASMKSEFARIEAKQVLLQWMLGLVIVVSVIPILKNLFA